MSEESSSAASDSLIREILRYVAKHPDAKDTIDGIDEFWLSQTPFPHRKSELYKVLEFLCETKHWLKKSKAGAAATLYGLNRARLREINKFLEHESKPL